MKLLVLAFSLIAGSTIYTTGPVDIQKALDSGGLVLDEPSLQVVNDNGTGLQLDTYNPQR